MLDLGRTARTLFCLAFILSQILLVATASDRPDRSYGFRMYDESATVSLHVARVLDDGGLLPIEADAWDARDCRGELHAFHWPDLVRYPAPSHLDIVMPTPYGVDSGLELARGALDYVASHTPDDCQTLALVADVSLIKNGGRPRTVRLEARRAPH